MNNSRNWHIIDAEQLVLGRLATQAAQLLMGKHKPGFVRHQDNGDYVIIVNAQKVQVTGNKEDQKLYDSYSGYPGGLKQAPLSRVRDRKPTYVVEHAVKGMLPKNRLQPKMMKRLKVFASNEHPYADKIKTN